MTFRTNSSSPTITSFYTVAEKARTKSKSSKQSYSIPPVPILKNGISDRAKTAWVASKSIEDITPYLCLRAKLSQVIFNKFTLLFIFLAIYIHLFAIVLNYSVRNVQSYLSLTCTTLSQSSLTTNSSVELRKWITQTSLQSIQNQVNAVNSQTTGNLNSTLYNILSSSTNYVSVLSDGYDELAKSAAKSALNAAINSTTSLNNWLNQTLGEAVLTTNINIQSLNNGLSQLLNALSQNSELFSNVQLGYVKDLNIDNISNITLPIDVNENLLKLASLSDFGFQSIASTTSSKLSELFSNVTQTSIEFGNSLSLNYTDSGNPIPNPNTGICPTSNSNNSVNTVFEQIFGQIAQLRKTYIVMFSCFAVVSIFLVALHEFFLWKNLLQQARILGTPGNFRDPIDSIMVGTQPTVSFIGMKLGLLFENNQTKTLIRWAVSFSLSSTGLFLITSATFFMIIYLCETSMIRLLSMAADTKIIVDTSLGSSQASNSSLTSMIRAVNNAVSTVQLNTNNHLQETLSGILNQTHSILSMFENDMSNNLRLIFNSTNITSSFPSNWSIKSSIPATLTFTEAIYPQLEAENLIPPLPSDSILSSISSSGIPSEVISLKGLTDVLTNIANVHLKLSLILLSFWCILAISSIALITIKSR